MNVKFGLLLGCLFPLCLTTQVTESERPKELGQLIMNCTPKVFCLTFGVQVQIANSLFILQNHAVIS